MVKIYKSLWNLETAESDYNRDRIEALEKTGFSVERYLVENECKKLEKLKSIEINLGQDLPVNW